MRRVLWNGAAIVVALMLAAVAWQAVEIERDSVRDDAQPAEVIMVMGAAEYRGKPSPVLRARLDHAFELYQRHLAPLIMTTGGAGGDPVFTEGGVGRSYLMGKGVPSEAILTETEGGSTLVSTALGAEIMDRMGLRSVIVVSDGYHVYRVKKMLEGRGFRVYGSPRKERSSGELQDRWNYVRQAVGYLLWKSGLAR